MRISDWSSYVCSSDLEAATLREDAKAKAAALVSRRQKMAEDKIGAAERAAIADIRTKAVRAATGAAASLTAEGHEATADTLPVVDATKGLGPRVSACSWGGQRASERPSARDGRRATAHVNPDGGRILQN